MDGGREWGWKQRESRRGGELCLHGEISKDSPEHICGEERCCSVMSVRLRLKRWERKCVAQEYSCGWLLKAKVDYPKFSRGN